MTRTRLFTPGDAAELAHAIEDLYRDEAARTRLADRARHVVKNLSWPIQCENYYGAIWRPNPGPRSIGYSPLLAAVRARP